MNPLVPDFILKRDAEGQTSGTIEAAALFVDISGFTTLTARLMQHGRGGREGAEALVRTLRYHFDPLVAAVHDAGGFIIGFAGDAFTAIFPLDPLAPPRPGPASVPPPPPGGSLYRPGTGSIPPPPQSVRSRAATLQMMAAVPAIPPPPPPMRSQSGTAPMPALHPGSVPPPPPARRAGSIPPPPPARRAGSILPPPSARRAGSIPPPPLALRPASVPPPPPSARPASVPPPPPSVRGRSNLGALPVFSVRRNAAEEALNASARMQRFFAENPVYRTQYGDFPFSIRIGLSAGKVMYWIVHIDARTAYYYFEGPAIDASAGSEHHAHRGDVVFDAAFRERVPRAQMTPIGPDLFRAIPTGEVDDLPLSSGVAPIPESGLFVATGITGIPPQGEFREVTSVFTCFEKMPSPPELIQQLHELSLRYGGTFTGLDAGDKGKNCLIHFGAPVAHENDTERAIDFAIELRRVLDRTTRIRAGITKGIRYVGFNGGSRRMEFACLGRATNLAARLMMSAQWGDIYCASDIAADAQTSYQFRDRGVLSLKGFVEPVAVASITRKKQVGAPKEFQAKELVGRQRELGRLTAAIEPIYDPGTFAGVIYVDGDAGFGKSYLVETLRRTVLSLRSPPCLWIDAPCDQTIPSALNPFEAALKDYCCISESSGREEKHVLLESALERLLAHIPEGDTRIRRELDEARSLFGALLGLHWSNSLYERLDPKARFDRTLSAIFAWLRAEAGQQPVIFHLEDAHWVDEETRRAIEVISRAAAAVSKPPPLAILCTARYRDDGTPCRFDLDRAVRRTEIALGPLSAEDIAKVAANAMGRPLPEFFRALLLDHAGGNPFFTEEIVAYWGEGETAHEPLLEQSFTAPSVALLPSDVNSLLIARLDRLPSALKAFVFAAAVLGVEFDLRILTAMLDETRDLGEQVRAIEKQHIWQPVSSIRFRFRNTLLRNAAYELQARARLQRLHLKAAEAIERVFEDDIDGHLAELARHYRRAEDNDKARHYMLRAARRATSRYAHAQAKGLYKAYLKLVGDEPTQESVVVRYELARDVYEAHGALGRAWTEHGQVIVDAQRLASRASEALGWLGRGRVRWAERTFEEAVECLEQALEISRQLGNRWIERRALAHIALSHRALGRQAEAALAFELALRIARELGEEGEATAFGDLLRRYLAEGRVDVAMALFEQAAAPGQSGA